MTGMLHIIQNDPEVPPGNIIDHLVIPHVVHHPYRDGILPEPEQISALIVLGGAMGANDDDRHPFLTDLKGLICTVVNARIPYLGICLGAPVSPGSDGNYHSRLVRVGSFNSGKNGRAGCGIQG